MFLIIILLVFLWISSKYTCKCIMLFILLYSSHDPVYNYRSCDYSVTIASPTLSISLSGWHRMISSTITIHVIFLLQCYYYKSDIIHIDHPDHFFIRLVSHDLVWNYNSCDFLFYSVTITSRTLPILTTLITSLSGWCHTILTTTIHVICF